MSEEMKPFASFLADATNTVATEQPTGSVESVQEVPSGTEAASQPIESQEQVATSNESRVDPFVDYLRTQAGLEIEPDVDPRELYQKFVESATSGVQATAEVQRLRSELESLRASQQQAPAAPSTQETVAQPETHAEQRARLFRELQRYDQALEVYVERDELGRAKPIASYGQAGIEAANKINEYEQASRQQAELLLRNPNAIIDDNRDVIEKMIEERARQIIDSSLAAERQQRELAAQQEQETAKQNSYQTALSNWHEENKAKLLRLNAVGEPALDPLKSGYVWTPTGKVFREKLETLRQSLPNTDELTLRNLALEFASAIAGQSTQTPAPPVAPAAPVAPALTPAEQRKATLAESRQVVPQQNTPQADVQQAVRGAPLRLADMTYRNPETSERIASWGR